MCVYTVERHFPLSRKIEFHYNPVAQPPAAYAAERNGNVHNFIEIFSAQVTIFSAEQLALYADDPFGYSAGISTAT